MAVAFAAHKRKMGVEWTSKWMPARLLLLDRVGKMFSSMACKKTHDIFTQDSHQLDIRSLSSLSVGTAQWRWCHFHSQQRRPADRGAETAAAVANRHLALKEASEQARRCQLPTKTHSSIEGRGGMEWRHKEPCIHYWPQLTRLRLPIQMTLNGRNELRREDDVEVSAVIAKE